MQYGLHAVSSSKLFKSLQIQLGGVGGGGAV